MSESHSQQIGKMESNIGPKGGGLHQDSALASEDQQPKNISSTDCVASGSGNKEDISDITASGSPILCRKRLYMRTKNKSMKICSVKKDSKPESTTFSKEKSPK